MRVELIPIYSNQKSFNHKAIVEIKNNFRRLYSYGEPIIEYHNGANGKYLQKIWNGYSPTTMKHINEFMQQCGFCKQTKAEWLRW